ncbi:MAG: DUF2937 family protein [Shimia sp.]
MFGRIITMAAGIAGAAAVSQFPEFSQQYLQRLAGQAETIETFVADFDADAARVGLTRAELLTEFGERPTTAPRAETMERYIRLEQVLGEQLATLREGSAFERLMATPRVADSQTAQGTWDDFRPALPLTVEGAAFAAVGFLAAWGLVSIIWGILSWPWRRARRRRHAALSAHHAAAHATGTPDHHHAAPAISAPSQAPPQTSPDEVAFAGGIEGLVGRDLPALSLPDTEGAVTDLSDLPDGTLLFTYPLMAQPGQTYPGGWDGVQGAAGSTALACALRDGASTLAQAGITHVVGISTQPTLAQAKVRHALNLPFTLLSDGALRLATALDLPRFDLHERGYYRQTLLVIEGGRIAHALHPITDHAAAVGTVTQTLRAAQKARA